MFVKPAPDVLLRDPVTKQLLSAAPVEGLRKPVTVVPEEGMQVDDFDGFWLRRIRDRDAVKVGEKAEATKVGSIDTKGAVQLLPADAEQEQK